MRRSFDRSAARYPLIQTQPDPLGWFGGGSLISRQETSSESRSESCEARILSFAVSRPPFPLCFGDALSSRPTHRPLPAENGVIRSRNGGAAPKVSLYLADPVDNLRPLLLVTSERRSQ